MKNSLFLVSSSLLLACAVSLHTSASSKKDLSGNFWTDKERTFKVGFLMGYVEGTHQMRLDEQVACTELLKHDGYSQKQYEQICSDVIKGLGFEGIQYGQLLDGVDSFYGDPANRQLDISLAINYARDRIRGKSRVDLDKEIELWRRLATEHNEIETPKGR